MSLSDGVPRSTEHHAGSLGQRHPGGTVVGEALTAAIPAFACTCSQRPRAVARRAGGGAQVIATFMR